jgi:hypothetical protein
VLLALGLVIALPLRGLFLKPHGDFYGIWETGDALLHGELPPSFKRAPVYPLLVTGTGAFFAAAGCGEVPAQSAAEWLNALLLPINGALVYWLARGRGGWAARWSAWWFLLLPVGMYCTTHLLVEPLLVTMILATLLAVQHESRWAWLWAALATMTRYDAAGALAGVLVLELLARRPVWGVLWRGALAGAPLVIWLALTAATWSARGTDHYLAEMTERPQFAPWPALAVTPTVTGDLPLLQLPYLLQGLTPLLRYGVQAVLLAAVAVGLVAGFLRQRGVLLVTLAIYAGYTLVHALFPFQFDRFGYPLSSLYLFVAAIGVNAVSERCAGATKGRPWVEVLAVAATLLLALAVIGEVKGFRYLAATQYAWVLPLPALLMLGTASLWGVSLPRPVHWVQAAGLLAACLLALAQLRGGVVRVSAGANMDNVVAAARWVRDEAEPEAHVLSATPGLLRLYAGRRPADRFLSFEDIAAESWPEILDECRQRHVAYIIWYEGLFGELGDYYVARCRLTRFAGLSSPESLPGVSVVRQWQDTPTLWVVRVSPE